MIPEAPVVIFCPSCRAALRRCQWCSGTMAFKSKWSDGFIEWETASPLPLINRCPSCQHVYRFDQAEIADASTIGTTYRLYGDPFELMADPEDAPPRVVDPLPLPPLEADPTEDDYLAAIDRGLARSSEEEVTLLKQIWWMANHRARSLIQRKDDLEALQPIDLTLRNEIYNYLAAIERYEESVAEKIAHIENTPGLADEVLSVWLEWRTESEDPLGRHLESWRRYSGYYMSKLKGQSSADDSLAQQIAAEIVASCVKADGSFDQELVGLLSQQVSESTHCSAANLREYDRKRELRRVISLLCPLPDVSPSRRAVELVGPPHEVFLEDDNFVNILRSKASKLLTSEQIASALGLVELELHAFEFTDREKRHLGRLADLLRGRNTLLTAELLRQLSDFDQAAVVLNGIDLEGMDEHHRLVFRATVSAIESKSKLVLRSS